MPITLDPYALTSLDNAKMHLNIGALVTTNDEYIKHLINMVSAMVEKYLDRKVITRSWTEYQDGRGTGRILLKQWPASKPSQLWLDDSGLFTDSANQIATGDYELEQSSDGSGIGVILINGRFFSKGRRNIKVVYNAGFATTPYDLEHSVLLAIEYFYDLRSDRRIGVTSKGKNQETTTYITGLPKSVEIMLDPYKRMEFSNSIAVENI